MAAETSPKLRPLMPLTGWLVLVAFLVGVGGAFYLWWHEMQTSVLILVPVRDLPAYYQVQPGDLIHQTYPARDLSSTTLREPAQILGHYTLVAVPQQRPLNDYQLGPVVDMDLISGTVPIGIPATPAMVLGGNLQAGDVVDIILVPAATEQQPSSAQSLFEEVLVLDVKPVAESQATDGGSSDHPFIVVIALPLDRRQEFATRRPGATWVITQRP
jgi:Flp pilus assembly protein CpaB